MFSTMWITYRSGFPRMEPYGYTDDSGWGCMLRSAQMLMTQALQRHTLGRYVRLASKGRPKHGLYLCAAAYGYPSVVTYRSSGRRGTFEKRYFPLGWRRCKLLCQSNQIVFLVLLASCAPPSGLPDTIVVRRE